VKRFSYRWIPVVVLLTIVSGAVGFLVFRQGPDEVTRYRAELRKSGEQLSLSDLVPPFSSEALAYHREIEELGSQLSLSPIDPGLLSMMNRTNGSFAPVLWEQPAPVRGKNGGTWEDFARQMEGEEAALSQIREMLDRAPKGSVYDRTAPVSNMSVLNWVRRRRIAQALTGAVVNHLHQSQWSSASTNLHALISLCCLHDEGGLLIDRMIQVAITSMAVAATWEALQAPGWNEERLARLQEDWLRVEFLKGLAGTMERERAWGLSVYEMVRTNMTPNPRQTPNLGTAFEDSIYTPFWETFWAEDDELLFLRTTQLLLASLRQAETNHSYSLVAAGVTSAIRDAEAQKSIFDRFRFQGVRLMLPNWQKACSSLFRTEATRQLAIAAIAVRRHQSKHRQLPGTLVQLVPEFLPSVPPDVMNGDSVRYRIIGADRFIIFSAGTNGIAEDAGGDDLSWPVPIRAGVGSRSSALE
jgi:hypothetical protein